MINNVTSQPSPQYSPPPPALRQTGSSRPTTPQRASPATSLSGSLDPAASPGTPGPFSDEGPSNVICPGCNYPFTSSDLQFKIALRSRWHLTCFKCITCQKTIDGDFINKGGPQCLECRNHPKTCVRCGQELNGTFLNIDKKWPYHPTCFTCYFCSVNLNQGVGINFYYSSEDKADVQFICDECKKKKKKT